MQLLYLFIAFLVVLCDQGLKYYISHSFMLGQEHILIDGLLSFTYVKNTGAAWNILTGQMWLFYIISIIAIIACLYFLYNKKYNNPIFKTGIGLVLGGVIGNFIDRLHLKYVIDMIQLDFINFNIFNIADSAITVGIVLIFVYLIFFSEKEEK
ncbi:MAG: signal peptidase II [Lactobacillus mulieris]|uniref:signal peptidase II n=1 Tax=Lactobacillus mulieris TaxID=2508708 RepID=UPI00143324F0|nr:signal peptidase II [Lactobacillus mulieris]MCF1783885.1 signal peptidase II [Lactobacillus mulieris]MCF1797776.1 signal peptidase II [Lactobacillus mulieris]MCT7674458.1 signal peptidase II [Lactobacillus mulieris]MCT7772583.1 signal peptidase II [Lactobacillus mulieris]MCW8104653.1 signal peptidase II [Lactobacillus mulieris]